MVAAMVGKPGIRARLARWLDPDTAARSDFLEQLARDCTLRLDRMTKEVHDECVRRHANGTYGWLTMMRAMPISALEWAREVELALVKDRMHATRVRELNRAAGRE